jgi:hypothetical protein
MQARSAPYVSGRMRVANLDSSGLCHGQTEMKRIVALFVVVAAIAPAALAPPVHALTPPQSAAIAAKARAEALARARAQAAAKARADAAAKARADAAAKSKALVIAKHGVQSETKLRVEAATKAANAQIQIKAANGQRSAQSQTPAQTPSKLQARQLRPLPTAARRQSAHQQYAQTARSHPSTSKSSAHAR